MHSVLEMDRDLEKSLQSIVKVKKLADISPSLLKQTNKENIVKLVTVLTGALTQSSELLRAAAADVDSLQSEHIKLQSELLSAKEDAAKCKDEELKEMKRTVKSEMKSWADVVSKNVKPSEITTKVIKEAVKSAVTDEDQSLTASYIIKHRILRPVPDSKLHYKT